jgi:hypothetical protein
MGAFQHNLYEPDEDEDSLPFALDDYGTEDYCALAAPAADKYGRDCGLDAYASTASALAQSGSSDAAIGALARMLQVIRLPMTILVINVSCSCRGEKNGNLAEDLGA